MDNFATQAFLAKLQAMRAYYGNVSEDVWARMMLQNASAFEINSIFTQMTQRQMMIDYAQDGTILGYGYANPMSIEGFDSSIMEDVNSNANPAQFATSNTFNPRINSTFIRDSVTEELSAKSGAVNALGQTVSTIADRIHLGVAGVNIGAKLGKWIDESLYKIDPEWWDKHLPTINPETWTSIAGDEAGKKFIRNLFDLSDDSMVSYMSEKILAQVYQCLRDSGAWSDTGTTIPGALSVGHVQLEFVTGTLADLASQVFGVPVSLDNPYYNTGAIFGYLEGKPYIFTSYDPTVNPDFSDFYDVTEITGGGSYTANHTFWDTGCWGWRPNKTMTDMSRWASMSGQPALINNTIQPWGNMLYIGNMIPHIPAFNMQGAPQYPPTEITGTDLDTVLEQLKRVYPDLFEDAIQEKVLQPNGDIITNTYVPVPWCNPNTQASPQPVTGQKTQPDLKINPETGNQLINDSPVNPDDNQFPDTGTGQSPVVLPVTSESAASLWSVYNPTHSQLSDFGAWLWSSDFVEQLKKMFNDPMQAIIGVHKVFANPHTGGTSTIKCGYLDSNVSSKTVTDQYTTVNCGTVSLLEYFGNVMDYAPFTSVRVYLPFIGIVPLNVADIMRSKISIKYTVDVITGACIAEISVKRDGNKSVIYTYSGSAIVTYPVSAGSYAGVIQGALSMAAGLLGGASAVPTVIRGATSMHADTSISGSFSGSAGAMGCKKPYLIISRPISNLAKDDASFEGYPSSAKVLIGECVGFIKCYEVHLRINTASDAELDEIRQLLLSGVRLTSANDGGVFSDPSYLPIIPLNAYENGVYNAEGYLRGYAPVTVDVHPNLENITITENGTYNHPDYDGYDNVIVNVPPDATIEPITISRNGVYNPPANVDGYAPVTVNVEGGGFSTDIKVENDTLVYDNTEINVTSQPVIVDGAIGASGSNGMIFNIIPTFTAIFEFDYTLASGGGEVVLSFGGSNTHSGIIVIRPNQFLYFAMGNRISQSISLTIGTQYHIKIIVTMSTLELYVDGTRIANGTSEYCQNIITYIFGKKAIGMMFNQNAHSEYNHGKMNNFRMYFEM